MTLGPFAKLPHPFLRVRLLKVRDRSDGRILLGYLEQPLIDAQSARLGLLLKTRSAVVRYFKGYVDDRSPTSNLCVSVTSVKDEKGVGHRCRIYLRKMSQRRSKGERKKTWIELSALFAIRPWLRNLLWSCNVGRLHSMARRRLVCRLHRGL